MERIKIRAGLLTGFFWVLFFFIGTDAAQAALGGAEFHNVDTWQNKVWQMSFGVRAINDGLDILNLRDTDVGTRHGVDPGDLTGTDFRISRLFGETVRLQFAVGQDDLDYGFESLKILNAEAVGYWRPFPWTQAWVGMRSHMAEDMKYVSSGAVNAMLARFKVKDTVNWDAEKVRFIRKTNDMIITASIPREGRPDPMIALEDLSDQSFFTGLMVGGNLGRLTPTIFVEAGRTEITSRITTTLDVYAEAVDRKLPLSFPLSLNRDETYVEAGVSCALHLTPSWRLLAEYSEMYMQRDKALEREEKNRILSSAFFWRFSDRVEVYLGARYFEKQLNGILPFLYNAYSETTFRHRYGLVYTGISFAWDGF